MQWNSFSEFVAMDGKALFIWGSYGVTLLCMLIEPWLAARRRRQAWLSAAQATHELNDDN